MIYCLLCNTVFGYLLAESCGRSVLPAQAQRRRNMVWGACCALLVEIGHGFLPADRASLWRWALSALGAGFGVTLYAAQMSVMQVLRGRRQNESGGALVSDKTE